jgi:hypothetical protein
MKPYLTMLREALDAAQTAQDTLLADPTTPDAIIVSAGELIARINLEMHRAEQRAKTRKEMGLDG